MISTFAFNFVGELERRKMMKKKVEKRVRKNEDAMIALLKRKT